MAASSCILRVVTRQSPRLSYSSLPVEKRSFTAQKNMLRNLSTPVLETTKALDAERGDTAKLWGSMIKQTLKRRHPGFNESFYGFASFNELLEEAQTRGYLKLELDEKSGGYVIESVTP